MSQHKRSRSKERSTKSSPITTRWDDQQRDQRRFKIALRHIAWCCAIIATNWMVFRPCHKGLNQRLSNYSKQVHSFAEHTPVRFAPYVSHVTNQTTAVMNMTGFRQTTTKWHRDLRDLQERIETKFNLEFERDHLDDDFEPVCSNVRFAYTAFVVADSAVLLMLVLVVLRILYKDFCTVYGANRRSVNIQFHSVLASIEALTILNYPVFQLSMGAVSLAYQFKRSVDALKKIQVSLLVSDDPQMFDALYVRASIWQGKRFGVKEPLSGIHLDHLYVITLRTRAYLLTLAIAIGVSVLMWRASVRSITRWRRNINAVCSIGIVVPNGKTIFRVGSGVLVNGIKPNGRSHRGSTMQPMVVTNWHCLHDIIDVSKSAASQQRTSLRLRTHVNVLQSQTSMTRKSCSYDAPGWKILIGVRDVEGRFEDIRWSYMGKIVLESPMREFVPRREEQEAVGLSETENKYKKDHVNREGATGTTTAPVDRPSMARQQSELYQNSPPNTSEAPQSHASPRSPPPSTSVLEDYLTGIDICVLNIEHVVNVHGLQKSGNNRNYIFELITIATDHKNDNVDEKHSSATTLAPQEKPLLPLARLPRFDTVYEGNRYHLFRPALATSLSVRISDQLRLMGYPPDAGGYDMSILTTFFTGVDYEDRQNNEGRYLLANTVLPNGFSGGAAVNDDGELVGICTAEHGKGISCIRDYVDVSPLVMKASQIVMDRMSGEVGTTASWSSTTQGTHATEGEGSGAKSVLRLRRQF
jgi:hypothetical protein